MNGNRKKKKFNLVYWRQGVEKYIWIQ